jgi:hypothetical protein
VLFSTVISLRLFLFNPISTDAQDGRALKIRNERDALHPRALRSSDSLGYAKPGVMLQAETSPRASLEIGSAAGNNHKTRAQNCDQSRPKMQGSQTATHPPWHILVVIRRALTMCRVVRCNA